jgi:integrase/recombinase XerD
MSEKHPRTKTAVTNFLNSRQASGLSTETVSWYRRMLAPFWMMCPDLPRRRLQLERYLASMQTKDENRFAHFRALRAFYGYLYPDRNPNNPLAGFRYKRPRKKIPYNLSLAELGYLQLTPLSKRDRAFVDLLADTGIRSSEALGVCREDVLQDTILVTGKTGQREVPISDIVREELLALPGAGLLFTGTRGPLTRSGAYRIVKLALAKAGISPRKAGPHTLRHTFGRQYIMAGGDLVSLQRILGHSDIATTRIYAELDLRDITIQHAKFSPLTTLAAVMSHRELKVEERELSRRLKN